MAAPQRGGKRPPKRGGGKAGTPPRKPVVRRAPTPIAPPPVAPSGPLTLGAVPGATPGKWIDRWNERMPRHPLILEPLPVAEQRQGLRTLDAAFVRLPIDHDGLHVIRLYDEVPVVVMASESALTVAEELTLDDLAGEVVVVPADDVLRVSVPGAVAPRFDAPATVEDAIATVATGVAVTIVPMSLARLHHRRDVTARRLVDGPASTIALAWEADRTTPLVEAFVGVVRGRTARSSRS